MDNFNFYAPTKMLFGAGKAVELPREMKPFGNRVLLYTAAEVLRKTGFTTRSPAFSGRKGLSFLNWGA